MSGFSEKGMGGDMLYAYIGIIASMALIPNAIIQPRNMFIIASIIIVYVLWMVVSRQKGYSLVLLSMIMCFPLVYADYEVAGPNYILTIYRIGMVIVLMAQMILNRKVIKYPRFVILGCIYAVIYIVYGLFVPADRLLYNAVHFLIYIALPFIICNNELLSLDEVYKGFTLIIIFTTVYAILQFHNIYCPYNHIYALQNLELADYFRARGILGNSLILMGALVFYQALCFIRLLSGGRISYIVELLIVYSALITLSRSVIIILLLQLILYLYFSKSSKIIIGVAVFFMLIISVGAYYFQDLFDSLIERFIQGFDEITGADFHRTAAMTSTFNLLMDNIWGVGPAGVNNAMHKYAASGLRQDFTLDNLFLKHIASYGLLAFIPLMYIFYPLSRAFKNRKGRRSLYRFVFFLMGSYALVGFSFCVDTYPQMNGIFFGCLGYIFYQSEVLDCNKLTNNQ